MDWFNDILLWGGDRAQLAWSGTKSGLARGYGFADDYALDPIFSRLVSWIVPICRIIGDAVYAALSPMPVWVGLTLISAVLGVVMLWAFGKTSNQKGIGRVKDSISANLLALKLFKDELHVTFGAQARLMWALVRQLGFMFMPIIILFVPMMLVVGQMAIRYQWRPLHPGEASQIRMQLSDESIDASAVVLKPHDAIAIEAVGPGGDDVIWRVRAAKEGRHTLSFDVNGNTIEKELVIGSGLQRVSAERTDGWWLAQLLHPGESPIPRTAGVKSIEIKYPGDDSYISGAGWWVLYFFIVSMAFALVFKPIFKVKF